MTAKVQLPGYCVKHDSHNCGCVCERRERPRLDRAAWFGFNGFTYYWRGTCPPLYSGDWIEYTPAPNLRKEGRS